MMQVHVTICLLIAVLKCLPQICFSQINTTANEQQMENTAAGEEGMPEDDSWSQQMEHFRLHPLNLNSADVGELHELKLLNELQINSIISYRNLFGQLVNIYELQAIPLWDVELIRKLLPFVSVSVPTRMTETFRARLKGGDHHYLFRTSRADTSAKDEYLGNSLRILARYKYTFKNLLQLGVVADKDAGEQFFRGKQKLGFDFYSVHLFARKIGAIEALALGDFTVNMGQGLIQWQSLSFRKSSDVLNIKRQSAVLRPYHSAGEFYFNRGAGLTIRVKNLETTFFASLRKLSANSSTDLQTGEHVVTSLLRTGYHRTASETGNRNILTQTSSGFVVQYKKRSLQLALNGVYYHFSLPIEKKDEPYNLYAIAGNNWYNGSVDFHYTRKNIHFFGETAIDKRMNVAMISGLLMSVAHNADVSILYRNIPAGFQSLYGNAFTENTNPTNEHGLYGGISLRPKHGWRIDAYADIFRFPWLRYRDDSRGGGADFLVQLIYTPNRRTELYTRFRSDSKSANPVESTPEFFKTTRESWRLHVNHKLKPEIQLRTRMEFLWANRQEKRAKGGFLFFYDVVYKKPDKPWSMTGRVQYFETDDYDSRIYAYENDVQFSYSVPSFSGRGTHYYIVAKYELGRRISVFMRLTYTRFLDFEQDQGLNGGSSARTQKELKYQVFYAL